MREGSSPSGRRLPALLLIAAYGMLLAAWVITNPPGATPDEPAHYVKAVAAGRGELVGAPASYPPGEIHDPLRLAWLNSATRVFAVPGWLAPPPSFACEAFRPQVSAACHGVPAASAPAGTELPLRSYVGNYEPYAYLVPGLLTRLADDPTTALLLGRTASALTVLLLLGLAVALAASARGAPSLLGLVLTVTPMSLYIGSSLNPNGPEIAAGICFAAGLLRLARPLAPPRWAWAATAGGGAVLLLARPLGPAWVAAMLLIPLVLLGPRGIRRRLRAGGRWGMGAVAVMVTATLGWLVWELISRARPASDPQDTLRFLAASLGRIPDLLREQVGLFGWGEMRIWLPLAGGWLGLIALLVGVALLVGSRRERLLLAVLILESLAATLAVAVAVILPSGFAMQGRYTLPLAVAVPLVAGDIVARSRHRWTRALPAPAAPLVFAAVAIMQAAAWWQNEHRYAVGVQGPLWFPPVAQWNPAGGWALWLAIVAVAAVAMAWSPALGRVEAAQSAPRGERSAGRT